MVGEILGKPAPVGAKSLPALNSCNGDFDSLHF